MNKEEIKIITLGDIFRNLETEEQAFEFLKYIKNLQQENKKYKEVIDKAICYVQENSCWELRTSKLLDILQGRQINEKSDDKLYTKRKI